MSLRIKKGDTVKVISGRAADKGRIGTVLEVNPKAGTAIVEGVRMMKHHRKAQSQERPGGIIEQEAAIQLSNLMLVDPTTQTAARFGVKVDENGNKSRVLKGDKEITV